MAATEAQMRATAKWQKEKTDEVRFRVPKGERAVIQAHANHQANPPPHLSNVQSKKLWSAIMRRNVSDYPLHSQCNYISFKRLVAYRRSQNKAKRLSRKGLSFASLAFKGNYGKKRAIAFRFREIQNIPHMLQISRRVWNARV